MSFSSAYKCKEKEYLFLVFLRVSATVWYLEEGFLGKYIDPFGEHCTGPSPQVKFFNIISKTRNGIHESSLGAGSLDWFLG